MRHVWGRREICAVFWFESQKDLDIGGRIIFKWLGDKRWVLGNMIKLVVL
jgi:hypothetical protein